LQLRDEDKENNNANEDEVASNGDVMTTVGTDIVRNTATNSATKKVSGSDPKRTISWSRIVGGAIGFSGQDDNVEDDGQGWITNKSDITIMKANGILEPSSKAPPPSAAAPAVGGPHEQQRGAELPLVTSDDRTAAATAAGALPRGNHPMPPPPLSQRAACATTNFDIATNVGCYKAQSLTLSNDIQVGFGKRNPNSAKGRERRGKKKRACGLRRHF
jgi:hypothetical protein